MMWICVQYWRPYRARCTCQEFIRFKWASQRKPYEISFSCNRYIISADRLLINSGNYGKRHEKKTFNSVQEKWSQRWNIFSIKLPWYERKICFTLGDVIHHQKSWPSVFKIKIYECLINIENSYLMEKFPVTFVYFGSFRQLLSPSLHI